jgi:hypothetical protein
MTLAKVSASSGVFDSLSGFQWQEAHDTLVPEARNGKIQTTDTISRP